MTNISYGVILIKIYKTKGENAMLANKNQQNASFYMYDAWMLVMDHVAKHAGLICDTQTLLRE